MHRTTSLTDRRGLTLIELLVTVFIILLITAVAIPVMAPSLEERRIRESSRLITGYLQGARTRAIQTGRPFGVVIEPLPGIRGGAVSLSYAEIQEPYAGDSVGSVVMVSGNGMIGAMGMPGMNSDAGWHNRIRPGDLIKFNHQGHLYRLYAGEPFHDNNGNGVRDAGEPFADVNGSTTYNGPAASDLDANGYFAPPSLVLDTGNPSNNRTWFYSPVNQALDNVVGGTYTVNSITGNFPFSILRQPQKTASPPLTLPEGMVIDLSGSTFGGQVLGPEPFNDLNSNGVRDGAETFTDIVNGGTWDPGLFGPFIILFSPNGSVAGLYHSVAGAPMLSTTPIHLLIGKQENVPAKPGEENWRDLSNLWVSIHPQTGLVTATEIGGDTNNDGVISLAESLFFARRGQGMGGR
jgi:prepilin-type N-terminal cleavage/methylation domain-containing protein